MNPSETLGSMHPALVHFPIALLLTYALLEFIPLAVVRKNLFITKSILVFLGTIAAFVARQSGEIASESFKTGNIVTLVAMHKIWATISVFIFFAICLIYLLLWMKRIYEAKNGKNTFRTPLLFTTNPIILIALSLAGIISISVTGALGGAIVWGPTNDPFVQTVYNLFVN